MGIEQTETDRQRQTHESGAVVVVPLVIHLQAGLALRQLPAQRLPALHLALQLALQADVLLPHVSLLLDVLGALLRV